MGRKLLIWLLMTCITWGHRLQADEPPDVFVWIFVEAPNEAFSDIATSELRNQLEKIKGVKIVSVITEHKPDMFLYVTFTVAGPILCASCIVGLPYKMNNGGTAHLIGDHWTAVSGFEKLSELCRLVTAHFQIKDVERMRQSKARLSEEDPEP